MVYLANCFSCANLNKFKHKHLCCNPYEVIIHKFASHVNLFSLMYFTGKQDKNTFVRFFFLQCNVSTHTVSTLLSLTSFIHRTYIMMKQSNRSSVCETGKTVCIAQ